MLSDDEGAAEEEAEDECGLAIEVSDMVDFSSVDVAVDDVVWVDRGGNTLECVAE